MEKYVISFFPYVAVLMLGPVLLLHSLEEESFGPVKIGTRKALLTQGLLPLLLKGEIGE